MRGAVCECTRGAGRVEVRWDRLSSYLKVKVVQSCTTLFDPIDYTVRAILQARILEWVAFPSSRGSSQPRNQSGVSCIAGRFFTNGAIREVPFLHSRWLRKQQFLLIPIYLQNPSQQGQLSA